VVLINTAMNNDPVCIKPVQNDTGNLRSAFSRHLLLILLILCAINYNSIYGQSENNSSVRVGNEPQNSPFSKTGNSRYLIKSPIPENTFADSGLVVVIVRINSKGRITKAQIDKIKSTTPNKMLYNSALKAANYARYNSIDKDTIETGQLTYKFKLK